MDKETFEKKKKYAGAARPSMLRRRVGHDYAGRGIYMVTLVTEDRRSRLFGDVSGRSDAPEGSADAPRMALSPLGEAVAAEFQGIPRYYPQIEVMSLQMMPDHLHAILFVHEQLPCALGQVLRGFKTGCNRHYRNLVAGLEAATGGTATIAGGAAAVACAAAVPQPGVPSGGGVGRDRSHESREHGLLFAPGFNDRLLRQASHLEQWKRYLRDNPRRLLTRREHPDLFRVRFGIEVAGQHYAAIGNRHLLDYPDKRQVQCSRDLTEEEIAARVSEALAWGEQGAVLVSPAISDGERAVMRAALAAEQPLIFITLWGFDAFSKPGHQYYEACAAGRLLLLAPWEHNTRRVEPTRDLCHALNAMAQAVCQA